MRHVSNEPDKDLSTSYSSSSSPVHEVVAKTSFPSHFLVNWIVPVFMLKRILDSPKYANRVLPVYYEDLVSSPESVWTNKVLPFCGLEMKSYRRTDGCGKTEEVALAETALTKTEKPETTTAAITAATPIITAAKPITVATAAAATAMTTSTNSATTTVETTEAAPIRGPQKK